MNVNQVRLLAILLLLIPVTGILFTNNESTTTATAVAMRLNQVVWGTDFNAPNVVAPGTVDTSLSVSITNLSNKTISGIQGILVLDYPFSDYATGGVNATAQGETLDDSFNRDVSVFFILAGEAFFLQYSITIDTDAKIGQYSANLELSYLVNSSGVLTNGTKVNFPIDLVIANRAPSIYDSYPEGASITIEENESRDFGVFVNDPDNQTLSVKWMFDTHTVVSTGNNYTFHGNSTNLGIHTLEAQVKDIFNLTASTTWDIDVTKPSVTSLTMNTSYLYAGFSTVLNVNLSNTVWTGTVDITMTVPEEVVMLGDSTSWTFTNVTEGETITLRSGALYAPLDLIGSTGSLTFDIEYSDYLGNDQTESVNKGIIIRGRIKMIVYDETTQYNSQTDRVSFSASVLNKGTLSAMFVNISLYRNPHLTLTLDSSSYIGELEQDDPQSFTIGAQLLGNPQEDTITVDAVLSWTDDLQEDLSTNLTFTLSLTPTSSSQTPDPGLDPGSVIGGAFILIVIAGTVIGALVILRRR
ncbi:MAG: COG1361 S-layer family protein [Candidatus Hodarchaeales archaeon]|jgi:hypothetical protein